MSSPTRVMLVDDHAVVRAGYRRLLELEADMLVVAECADADAAYALLQRQPVSAGALAEVMVLDLSMPGRSGLDLLRRVRLRWPSLRVLIFTMHDSPVLIHQSLRAGAAGFVTKSSPPEELVAAVRAVCQGGPVLSQDVAAHATPPQTPVPPAPHEQLSAREFDVLRHLITGLSLEDIAQRLCLSPKTVANQQSLIRQKLGVSNAVELLRYAQWHGLDG
jgi:two-component system, NarL family, response regulator FusR